MRVASTAGNPHLPPGSWLNSTTVDTQLWWKIGATWVPSDFVATLTVERVPGLMNAWQIRAELRDPRLPALVSKSFDSEEFGHQIIEVELLGRKVFRRDPKT